MKSKSGFTLIELLVVMAVIGILMGLLLPAVQQVREAARRVQCGNNIRQLGLAVHHYHDARGRFPIGVAQNSSGYNAYGAILPYIELNNLKDDYDYDPTSVSSVPIGTFQCPTSASMVDQDGGMPGVAADYAFCKGRSAEFCDSEVDRGIFGWRSSPLQMTWIQDGTSHTMMIGEAASDPSIRAAST